MFEWAVPVVLKLKSAAILPEPVRDTSKMSTINYTNIYIRLIEKVLK